MFTIALLSITLHYIFIILKNCLRKKIFLLFIKTLPNIIISFVATAESVLSGCVKVSINRIIHFKYIIENYIHNLQQENNLEFGRVSRTLIGWDG